MYHEHIIGHYESCSLETLQNALWIYEEWHVVESRGRGSAEAPISTTTTTKARSELVRYFLFLLYRSVFSALSRDLSIFR